MFELRPKNTALLSDVGYKEKLMLSYLENKFKSLIYVFICIILWAFIPVVSRFGQANLDNYQFLFWSSLSSFFVLLLSTIFFGKVEEFKNYDKNKILNALGLGFLGAFLYYVLLYYGYANAEGLEVLIIQYTWPIFIILFSFLFLKEKITLRNIISMTLGFASVFIILTKGNFTAINFTNLYVDIIVLSAASIYALFSVLSKKINFEPFTGTTLFFLSATICSFIAMLLFSHFEIPLKNDLIPILSNGIFINGLSYIFWLKGLSYGKASFIAPFIFLIPIIAAILIIIIFKEAFLSVYFLGLALVILAGLFI